MFTLVLVVAPILLFGGMLLYLAAIAIAYIFNPSCLQTLKQTVSVNGQLTIGLPLAALAAFALVSIFWEFMPNTGKEPLALQVFGLAFSGSSGPISLWLACFLTFVVAMKTLSK